ncbi:MAG: ABC transporter permease [Pseudomonadota bacterium]
MSAAPSFPRWIEIVVLPIVNLMLAFLVAGVVVVAVGENPFEAISVLITGAVGSKISIGYTLFYATNFIFTGLAVALAFHCGLFNIGGEGQAYIGGLGIGLVCLYLDILPPILIVPVAIAGGAVFGALWAFLPGYLQATRGSHIVITTIMFNFIAAALMVFLMTNVLILPGQMSPESRPFIESATLSTMQDLFLMLGTDIGRSPLNLSFFWALVCCVGTWVLIWHTPLGYAIRSVGQNTRAAIYCGIKPTRIIVITMLISGAMAGFLGLNEIMGFQERLILNFTGGYGFVGIAVSLMGRNHPVGIFLAAILFGALYQGGTELSFEFPALTKEVVIVMQGLIILFAGALEYMLWPAVRRVAGSILRLRTS